MGCRSAILIDDFLSQDTFNTISSQVAIASEYNTTTIIDTKDDLWRQTYNAVFDRMKEINLYHLFVSVLSSLIRFKFSKKSISDFYFKYIMLYLNPHVAVGNEVDYRIFRFILFII